MASYKKPSAFKGIKGASSLFGFIITYLKAYVQQGV